ncbi:hypothetical protein M5689_013173 [Euphorbia peplus]|nr:hypothetical protein M5689_013173 [Euphorbia peplus]
MDDEHSPENCKKCKEFKEMGYKSPESNLNYGDEKKFKHNFDLNLPTDLGFDLNKFPEEGAEAFEDEGMQEVYEHAKNITF